MKMMVLLAALGMAGVLGMGTRAVEREVAGVYHSSLIPVWTIGGVPIPREGLPTA
ncbi:MAG TPA: hypothetical protein VM008_02440 [Phycisphaerae bacterium]|nr:hypothetical protein [Phycisphaerae bacterium]